ncbi:MAG: DUF1995 family protein [Cyanobacteria bacterium J06642_2]
MPETAAYPDLPDDLADAQAQALEGVRAALAAGYSRLQVDILVPEIKPDVLAQPFAEAFEPPFAFLFADAGAAALAKRNWNAADWTIAGVNQGDLLPAETAIVFAAPTVVEMGVVEALCVARGEAIPTVKRKGDDTKGRERTPILLLNPQLQDAATVGIGLAGRQLRERFISTLEPCYFLQAFGAGAMMRQYPHPWTVWILNKNDEYELLETCKRKPTGEDLAKMFAKATNSGPPLLGDLVRFIKALGS